MAIHVDKFHFRGDPNVGLYAVATDKFVLVGKTLSKTKVKHLEEIFKVPVIQISIYSTDMIGVFACANSNTVLLPEVVEKEELEEIKKKIGKLATVKVVKTTFNALGNNILVNDTVAIFNEEIPKAKIKEIQEALGVKKIKVGLKNIYPMLPGAAAVLTNKGGVFSTDLLDDEVASIEKLVGFEVGLGTASMGGKMLGSGVVANSNGFIVSTTSSGFEMGRIDESLGFLNS